VHLGSDVPQLAQEVRRAHAVGDAAADRRVLSGIIFVIKGGLRWRDAPPGYGPHKTLYNRFVRWSRMGVFSRIFAALAGEAGEPDRLITASAIASRSPSAASRTGAASQPATTDAPQPSSAPSPSPPSSSSGYSNES
jgi:putative transposase